MYILCIITACQSQGHFLDFLRHVSFKFDRTLFHDVLHDFVEEQKQRLEQALSNLLVEEAMDAKLDLQALSLILSTRFALYKRTMSELTLQEHPRRAWKRLVDIQESIIDEDLGKQGEHFAVLEVFPSMPHRDGEIQLPSSQEVKQAYHRKSKQYHMDKRYHPDRQQARISTSVREKMMPKVTGAFEFLQGDANRQGFCNRIAGLFRLEGGVACFVLSLMN
jgi:hypothetical protein